MESIHVAAAPLAVCRGVDLSASWKDDGGGWRGGVHGFMAGLPIATWFFVGVVSMAPQPLPPPPHRARVAQAFEGMGPAERLCDCDGWCRRVCPWPAKTPGR